jgi:periplasmic protein TonB
VYFLIDEEGVVAEAQVEQASGHQALDQAAVRVARQFRFSPALNRGEPVPVWVQIPIRFETR